MTTDRDRPIHVLTEGEPPTPQGKTKGKHMRTMKRIAAATAVVSALTMTAACGGSSSGDTAAEDSTSSSAPSSSPAAPESSDAMADPAANLVGPGCAAYAEQVPDGSGSVAGMAQDPVATAASNNPLLKTLVAAVSGKLNPKVNLVDTLNGGEFTVFAPVDSAFAKLPKATVKTLSTPKGAATRQSVLTYHVVPGPIAPDEIVGMHKTVQGGTVKVTGSGDNLKVDGSSSVVCGGVQTANATVYLIDSVLMPKM
jgi:uncharacterized surface protein with fasciclin (FAS1) repeats